MSDTRKPETIERLSDSFLEHAARCTSQYDSLCRRMAADIIESRAMLRRCAEKYREYERIHRKKFEDESHDAVAERRYREKAEANAALAAEIEEMLK
jgi:hypothetical protein